MKSRAEDRILTVAAQLFMERGCAATSVREVAEAAEVSISSLYHWFGSKDNLVFELHQRMVGEMLRRLHEAVNEEESAADQLRAVMRVVFSVLETHRAEVVVFLREGHALPPELRERINADRHNVDVVVDAILRRGVANGEFRSDADVRLTRLAFLGASNWAYQWFHPDAGRSGEEIADTFTALLCGGLLA